MRDAYAILSYVARSAVQYFSTLSDKRRDFRKKKLLRTKCVFLFSLQLLSKTFLLLRTNKRDMIKSVHWSSCKVADILV